MPEIKVEAQLIAALQAACDQQDLIFQVVTDLPYLYIYLNRVSDTEPDYTLLAEKICTTVTNFAFSEFTGLGIFSRPCDLLDPDWQTFLELPGAGLVELASEQPEPEQPKPEPEPSKSHDPVAAEEVEPAPAPAKTMAEYCFIRNKALLTAKVLPPSTDIAQLVKFFHLLTPEQQAELLPVLDIFLRTPKSELAAPFSPEIQDWLQQLAELKDMNARNAAIWLSRYCLKPEATMVEIMAVLAPKPVVAEAKPSGSKPTDSKPSNPTAPPPTANRSPVAPAASSGKSSTPQRSHQRSSSMPAPTTAGSGKVEGQKIAMLQGGKLSPEWTLFLSVGWFFFTLIAITVALHSVDPNKIATATCGKSSNVEYCRLGLQVTGEIRFSQDVPQRRFALTPDEQQAAQSECALFMGGSGNEDEEATPRATPTRYATTVEPLTGFLVTDLQQDHPSQPGTLMRTVCTFVKVAAAEPPEILNAAEIPSNWPQTAFKPERKIDPETFRRALGVFDVIITLGAGTLFTALALFLAAFFRLGVSIDSIESLFKAAFCLGIVEAVAQFIPRFGIFGWLAIQSLSLGITSIVVPGFRVHWADGYWLVSIGTVVINVIRLLLNLLLFIFLAGLVLGGS